jgi:hypothetical protein
VNDIAAAGTHVRHGQVRRRQLGVRALSYRIHDARPQVHLDRGRPGRELGDLVVAGGDGDPFSDRVAEEEDCELLGLGALERSFDEKKPGRLDAIHTGQAHIGQRRTQAAVGGVLSGVTRLDLDAKDGHGGVVLRGCGAAFGAVQQCWKADDTRKRRRAASGFPVGTHDMLTYWKRWTYRDGATSERRLSVHFRRSRPGIFLHP